MSDPVSAEERAHALGVEIKTLLEGVGVYGGDVDSAGFVVDVGGRPYQVSVRPRADVGPDELPAVS